MSAPVHSSPDPPCNPAWEVTPRQVKAMLDKGEPVVLLDCRTPKERAVGSIAGSIFLPMQELSQRLNELRPYADSKVVVYCHHGRRSLNVTAGLRQAGFSDVASMAGGIDLWSVQVDPKVSRY